MARIARTVPLHDGGNIELHDYSPTTEMPTAHELLVRTRHGKKVHIASEGSSVTYCGVWMKVSAQHMAVDSNAVQAQHICENCLHNSGAKLNEAPSGRLELREDDPGEYVQLPDALGTGIDARLYRNRGILSVVLVGTYSQQPVGPSAELNIDDMLEALRLLGVS